MQNTSDKNVAIVGFGLSGLLAFMNLVQKQQPSSGSLTIHIFEKSDSAPKGIAYSTTNINHLLNVPSHKMGVIEEDREHFYKWLVANDYEYTKDDFVPRKIFGIYLEDIKSMSMKVADQKKISYRFFNEEISEIAFENSNFTINKNSYNYCIIATGARLKNRDKNFWNVDLAPLLTKEKLHITGCGLTGFDAAISLRDLGYEGKIFMHSRTAKMPQVTKYYHSSSKVEIPLNLEDAALPMSKIFHKFVKACKDFPEWRMCFDAVRPMVQSFWMALSVEKKKRFMRHCFRMWNIHRHRCPEVQHQAIQEMIKSGQIIFSKSRAETKDAIDCTGFDYGFKSSLINSLIEAELVVEDELSLGVISQNKNLHVMGSLSFGSSFEITSVPDITPQANQICEKIMKS